MSAPAKASRRHSRAQNTAILVVDDNMIMRKMVRVALEAEGYLVYEAADGQTAIEMATRHRPTLVLQDLLLPDMDGFELVKRLRQLPGGQDMPILAFSGFLSKLEQSHALQAGFTDHLFKPVEPSLLVQTVAAHLPTHPAAQSQPSGKRRVLVADDDPVQLKLLKIHLQQLGFEVQTAVDGDEALALARLSPPDAIVSDVLMPRLDGFRLAIAIRQDADLAGVPVVLTSSAYTEEADRNLAHAAGANDLVQRTPDLNEVTQALLASLNRQAAAPHEASPELPLEDYTHRVLHQLQRQVGLNSSLTGRLSILEARFSILATLAKSLTGAVATEAVLDEMLTSALDAFAISRGLAFLTTPDGHLELRGHLGYPEASEARLSSFFGHQQLLRELMAQAAPTALPSPLVPPEQCAELLHEAGGTSLLIAPLVLFDKQLGVLVTAAAQKELGSDWISFAQTLGAQVGQAIGLARALSQLQANEERYRTIVETAGEAIMLLDDQFRLTFVNAQACDMLGCTSTELVGRSMLEFVHDSQRAAVLRHLQRRRDGMREQYESHLLRKDGSDLWVLTSASPLFDAEGRYAGSIGLHIDVTARKQAEDALSHQALHDGLTGLPNRTLLNEHLRQAILTARRMHQRLALLMLDLDRFKEVNDAFGHHYGDLLLRQIGPRLRSTLRESDTIARLGGDEFAVILPSAGEAVDASLAVKKILASLAEPFSIEGRQVEVGASVGIVIYPDDGEDAETLLRRADVAMYAAKSQHSGYMQYKPDQDEHTATRLMLTSDLRHAIDHGELIVHYQPKVDFKSGRLVAVESLVRWQHPRLGLMGPDNFIPLAEQTGLIQSLTDWVLRESLGQCRAWRDRGLHINVAVNQSMRNLHDPELPARMAAMLDEFQLRSTDLTIEITESMLMADPQRALEVVTELSDMGISLSIDDFGTGYSSLAYLKRLPVSEIKVDKSFVLDMVSDESDATIVRSTIDLAHNLGLKVVAEGVETVEMWNALAGLECDVAQGYYVARPLPADALDTWLLHNAH